MLNEKHGVSIEDLVEILEKGNEYAFELDAEIQALLLTEESEKGRMWRPYTRSVDAAIELCSLVLPGWTIASIGQDDRKGWHAEIRHGFRTSYSTVSLGGAANASRALCLAILKAKQSEGEAA